MGVDTGGGFCALRPDSARHGPERNMGALAAFHLGAPALGLLPGILAL